MNRQHNGLDARAIPLRVAVRGGANASCVASMPAVPGWVNVITGYDYTGTGATVGTVVDIAISGILFRKMAVPASPLSLAADSFRPPTPLAVASNTAIQVTVPALGAGNIGGELVVYGYRVPG